LETPGPNKVYMGGSFGQAQVDDSGILAALDVRSNRLVWRQEWRDICYSGSVVTAGGLLFVGRSDGRLTALDKANGAMLWQFQTDAGVNTTVTTFEHKGRQLVAVHAGGGAFANGKRGDGVWMFSLDGKIGPIAAATTGSGSAVAAVLPATTRPASAAGGAALYKAACVACHGDAGTGGHGGGPTLLTNLAPDSIRQVTTFGRNNMPTFRDVYTPDQIQDVGAYVVEVLARAKP
jgi:mono/diheme cytochrome c family protein